MAWLNGFKKAESTAPASGLDFGTQDVSPWNISGWSASKDLEPFLERSLTERFMTLGKEGVYGKTGIDKISRQMRMAQMLRRRQLARGMQQSLGRRLGPRSGAVDTLIANQVDAPMLSDYADMIGQLEQQNQTSRLGGYEGLRSLLESRRNRNAASDASSGSGWLEGLTGLATLASSVL
jgi:hypothetical protein